jgi:hypothetical protein
MYNGSTILLCVTIFVIHKQCLIRAYCSIVTVAATFNKFAHKFSVKLHVFNNGRIPVFSQHGYPLRSLGCIVFKSLVSIGGGGLGGEVTSSSLII